MRPWPRLRPPYFQKLSTLSHLWCQFLHVFCIPNTTGMQGCTTYGWSSEANFLKILSSRLVCCVFLRHLRQKCRKSRYLEQNNCLAFLQKKVNSPQYSVLSVYSLWNLLKNGKKYSLAANQLTKTCAFMAVIWHFYQTRGRSLASLVGDSLTHSLTPV